MPLLRCEFILVRALRHQVGNMPDLTPKDAVDVYTWMSAADLSKLPRFRIRWSSRSVSRYHLLTP